MAAAAKPTPSIGWVTPLKKEQGRCPGGEKCGEADGTRFRIELQLHRQRFLELEWQHEKKNLDSHTLMAQGEYQGMLPITRQKLDSGSSDDDCGRHDFNQRRLE